MSEPQLKNRHGRNEKHKSEYGKSLQAKAKTCSTYRGCGKRKPVEEFNRHPTQKYGRASICKECERVWRKERGYDTNPGTKTLRVLSSFHALVALNADRNGHTMQEHVVKMYRLALSVKCLRPGCCGVATKLGVCSAHIQQVERELRADA